MATVTADAARRPRAYVRVQGPDAVDYLQPHALERRAREEGSADALLLTREGARDRAACSSGGAATTTSCSSPSPSSARRSRAQLVAHALRRQVRDRARGARLDDRLRRAPTGSRTATTACPRSRCSTPSSSRRSTPRSSSGCRIEAGTPRFGARDRRPRPARRGRPRRARDLVHEGLLPGPGADRAAALPRQGQPPPARARARRRAPTPETPAATARRRSAASRARCPGSRSPTCASRCRTTPS